jgi:hypothetical protein
MHMNDTTGRKPDPTTSRKDPIFQRGPDWSLGKPYGRVPRHWQRNVKTLLELQVLNVLASYADASGVCHPKIKTIVHETRSSERSIRRTLSALEKRGFLQRTARGGHLASTYLLLDFEEPKLARPAIAYPP